MAKAAYNHKEPNALAKLILEASKVKDRDLTKTQNMLKAKGYGVAKSNATSVLFTSPSCFIYWHS